MLTSCHVRWVIEPWCEPDQSLQKTSGNGCSLSSERLHSTAATMVGIDAAIDADSADPDAEAAEAFEVVKAKAAFAFVTNGLTRDGADGSAENGSWPTVT